MSEEQSLPPEATPAPQPVVPPPAPVVPGPEMVELNIAGRPYKIERGLADLLASQQPQAPAPAPAPVAAPIDPMAQLDTLWYTNPREAYKLIREDVTNSLRQEYQQERTQENFWNGLYQEAPELRRLDRGFVQNVVQKNAHALRNLSDAEGMKRISALAQQEVLAMSSAFGQTAPQEPQQPLGLKPYEAEGQRTGVPRAAAPQVAQPAEDQQPLTLSALIKQRKAIRRQAASGHPVPAKE